MKRTFFIASIVALSALSASAQDSNTEYSAQDLLPVEKTYRFKPTHNTIRTNFNLGKITSDVYYDNDSKHAYHPAMYGYQLDYEHLFGDEDGQHGFRITGAVSGTSELPDVTLIHCGAAYVYNYTTTLGWVWSMSAGMGYSYSHEEEESGFGAVVGVGCDYKICRWFGFGADIRYRSDRFSTPKDVKLKDNEFYGFKHISLLIGPRFYF